MAQVERQTENKRAATKDRKKSAFQADGWRGFANVELTDVQKKAVKALLPRGEELWQWLMDVIQDGYRCSISYDGAHTSYVVSLTCREATDKNNGLTLTARGGHVTGAICALFYKHTVVLKEDWNAAVEVPDRAMGEEDVG